MMNTPSFTAVLSLICAFFGAWLATLLGMPAAALLGSTIIVSIMAFSGYKTTIPNWLKGIAFTTIGCSLGSSVTPDIFMQFSHWYISITALILSLISSMVVSSWVLRRFYGFDQNTALLATSPGALSYSLSLSETTKSDVRAITILQGLRLLTITLGVPFLLDIFEQAGNFSDTLYVPNIGYIEACILMCVVFLAGSVANRYKLPAAHLILGLLISGALHATDTLAGKIPDEMLFIGFTITGTVIGSRFSSFTKKEILSLSWASASVILLTTSLSAFASFICAEFLNLPFGQVWVAFAPGGLEAMAAMALSLDFDPAYVATHHIFRMLFLILLLPLLLRKKGE